MAENIQTLGPVALVAIAFVGTLVWYGAAMAGEARGHKQEGSVVILSSFFGAFALGAITGSLAPILGTLGAFSVTGLAVSAFSAGTETV